MAKGDALQDGSLTREPTLSPGLRNPGQPGVSSELDVILAAMRVLEGDQSLVQAGLKFTTEDVQPDRNWLLAAGQSKLTVSPSREGNLGVGGTGNAGNMTLTPGASRALADARADINTEGSRLKKALDKSSRDPVARDLAGRALAVSMHPLLRR